MLEKHNKRDKTHLMSLIGRRSQHIPNFALLIGAGASASSGIKTANQMIAEWRQQLYEQSKSDEPFEKWLQRQDWCEDDEEYAILFEKVCDQRSQRRIYIEKCVKDAKPSWGYIYLSNMIANNYFNVIFTPNFDDLLNETCFLYADLRPIVCAHDSAVADIRITSARPKIIKLHGDFLYDSIKSTIRETESLEKNMREKFMQFAREYGLIVAGYGGNDRSIMDILDTMLRSASYFPDGVYWCIRSKDKISKKLKRLMRRENIYWVEIKGFDEFMAELHEKLELSLPDAVRNPYEATTKRLNKFISSMREIEHPIIKKDIAELEEHVKGYEKVVSGKKSGEEFDRFVPYRFLGDREFRRSNYKNALTYYKKALIQNPNELDIMWYMVDSYNWTEQFNKAAKISEKMIEFAPDDWRGYFQKGVSLSYLSKIGNSMTSFDKALKYTTEDQRAKSKILTWRANILLIAGNWKQAFSDAEKASKIMQNDYAALVKCIILKKLGRDEEARKILQDILPKIGYRYGRAVAFAALGDKENMLFELKAAIKKNSGKRVDAKFDPAFVDYREDPDFRRLLYEGKG